MVEGCSGLLVPEASQVELPVHRLLINCHLGPLQNCIVLVQEALDCRAWDGMRQSGDGRNRPAGWVSSKFAHLNRK